MLVSGQKRSPYCTDIPCLRQEPRRDSAARPGAVSGSAVQFFKRTGRQPGAGCADGQDAGAHLSSGMGACVSLKSLKRHSTNSVLFSIDVSFKN